MSSSSISVIPTLDMSAQQGAELNRDIQINTGHTLTMYNAGDTVPSIISAISTGLLIDINTLLSPRLYLRNSGPVDISLRNANGNFNIEPDGITNVTSVTQGAALGVPTVGGAPGAPANGDMHYDTSLNKFRVYENGAWANMV